MTNTEIYKWFAERAAIDFYVEKRSHSMMTLWGKLFSYHTCIAEWHGGRVLINKTKYSRTTSKQLSQLLRFIPEYLILKELDDVPRNCAGLVQYCQHNRIEI